MDRTSSSCGFTQVLLYTQKIHVDVSGGTRAECSTLRYVLDNAMRIIISCGLLIYKCSVRSCFTSLNVRRPATSCKFGTSITIMSVCRQLTLKAPITTAAGDKFCDMFPNFRHKLGMIFHENRLPAADDSHKVSCLICYF